MHDIFPEIPLATLATVNADNFDGYIAKAAEFNMAFDCSSQSSYANFANSNLKDRGYPVWQWTYDDASCAAIGVSGITNNVADEFKDHIKFIPEPTIELEWNAELQNAEFTIDAVTFGGETKKVKAIPLVTEATEGGFDAVLTVTDEASAKGLQRMVKAKIVVSSNSSSGGASQKGCKASPGSNYRILAAAFVAIIILKINVKKEKI